MANRKTEREEKYMEVIMHQPGDTLLTKVVIKGNTIEFAVAVIQLQQPKRDWNIGHVITYKFITKEQVIEFQSIKE